MAFIERLKFVHDLENCSQHNSLTRFIVVAVLETLFYRGSVLTHNFLQQMEFAQYMFKDNSLSNNYYNNYNS